MSRFLIAFVALLLLVACDTGTAVPQVTSVSFGVFTKDASHDYVGQGSVEVTADPANTITQLSFHLVPNGLTVQDGPPLSEVGYTSPFQVSVGLPGALPAGDYQLLVTATDSAGNTSLATATSGATITLQSTPGIGDAGSDAQDGAIPDASGE